MALSNKQRMFLNAMLTSKTVDEATKKANISSATAQKYLKDDDFKKEFRTERRKITDNLTSQLLQLGTKAVATLEENLNDPEATAASKNTAAKTILDYIYRSHEQDNIIERIELLEAMLEE